MMCDEMNPPFKSWSRRRDFVPRWRVRKREAHHFQYPITKRPHERGVDTAFLGIICCQPGRRTNSPLGSPGRKVGLAKSLALVQY